MLKQIAILMLILGIFFLGLATADTTRSCKARFVVDVKSIDNAESITYPYFVGHGTTTLFTPNEARKRARGWMERCIGTVILRRDLEDWCCHDHIDDYPFPDGLIQQITNDLCSRYPGHDTILIDLHVIWGGDTGCVEADDWTNTYASSYPIYCRD